MNKYQNTIQKTCHVEGGCLHSGKYCKVTFEKMPPDSGIIFKYKDTFTKINHNNTHSNGYSTKLETNDGHDILLIEHLLAALSILQIDNIMIILDYNEVPILDGSANLFCKLFKSIGIEKQNITRKYIQITKPITFNDNGNSITCHPTDNLFSTYKYNGDFNHPILNNKTITTNMFSISKARTFGFYDLLSYYKDNGIAIGANKDNCLIYDSDFFYDDMYELIPDESYKHKVLDMVGDMYCGGLYILANFIGNTSGHICNNGLLNEILNNPKYYRIISLQ